MSKQYRLLKDLPQCKAGTIFEKYSINAIDYEAQDIKVKGGPSNQFENFYLHDTMVENNPEWFVEHQNGVEHIGGDTPQNDKGDYQIVVRFHYPISRTLYPIIKQAIEQALNSNGEDTDILPTDFLKEFDSIEVGDYLMPSKEFVALIGKLKNFYVKIKKFDHAAKWRMIEHSLTASRNRATTFF